MENRLGAQSQLADRGNGISLHDLREGGLSAVVDKVVACQMCGLVQRAPALAAGKVLRCARCNTVVERRIPNSRQRTLAFSLAALVLYVPSNAYPLVTAEYMGQHSETTIFDGISSLFGKGQYFIAGLVFCTSILTPALKILGLLFLAATVRWRAHPRVRTLVYKAIRVVDPWNMLEVYLLSILVSMAEMGEIASIHPGPGVFSFAAVVVLTILATLSFDPRLVWDSAAQEAK